MLVDPKVYDSPEFDAPLPERAQAAQGNYTAPEPAPQSTVLTGQASTAAAFIQQQQNARVGVTTMESVDAALQEGSVGAALRKYSAPDFATDPTFNAGSRIPHMETQLSKDDREYLLESKSNEEFDYRAEGIQRFSRNVQLMGDNAAASFLATAIDPAYLAIDAVSMGAGHLAAIARIGRVGQRLAVAGVAGGGAVGVSMLENESRPVTTTEVVLGALINGAASAAFYSPITRSIHPHDPDFPSTPLHDVANNGRVEPTVGGATGDAVVEVVPVYQKTFKANAEPVHTGSGTTAKATLMRMSSDTTDPLLATMATRMGALLGDADVPIQSVKGLKQSFYDMGTGKISMREGASDWVHMHEIAHSLTAERIRYGRANPETPLGKVSAEIEALHAQVKQAVQGKNLDGISQYLTKNVDEFMAGLYSGHKPFYDALKAIPVQGGNALSAFVNSVRKVLGLGATDVNALTKALGLTDDLMTKPLKVKTTTVDPNGMYRTFTRDLMHEPPSEPSRLAEAIVQNADSTSQRIAKGISWSLHKTLSSFSPEMRSLANTLVDDPLDMAGDSVVSQTRAARADLAPHQYKYEDALKRSLADAGFGVLKRIVQPKQALAAQGAIERKVMLEMLAREASTRLGRVHPVNPDAAIKGMADSLDTLSRASLAEMKAAGVRGAEDVAESSGYFSRRWDINKIEDIEGKLIASGLTESAARSRVVRALAQGMRRANGWEEDLASDIAKAVIDRTRRKGYFEDSAFRSHIGNDNLAEVRDILEGAGLRGERLQRALDVMAGVTELAW
uniref:Internal virion protein n=1 Tax=Pseudomonas phage Draal03 TaxID=3138530 RepID=A0AAU6W267_9VIRU